MAPRIRSRIEVELGISNLNAKSLQSSNSQLRERLRNKNSELMAKDREISELKSVIAKQNGNLLEPTHTKAVPHSHPDQQRTDKHLRKHLDVQQLLLTGSRPQKPELSLIHDRPVEAIQKLLKDAEEEKETLRQVCEKQTNKIKDLEDELLRILEENEKQHSKLEDCLEEKKSLKQSYDYIHECYRKLEVQNSKVAGFKRSLAVYLSDVGFSEDDFAAALKHSESEAPPPKKDISPCATKQDQIRTPVKYHAAQEALASKFSNTENGLDTRSLEPNHENDSFSNSVDANTIIVVRKVMNDTFNITNQIPKAITGPGVRGTNMDEGEEFTDEEVTDEEITDDGDDGDANIEGVASETETETDAASEYNPSNDWDVETKSDREMSSAEDSDYKP